VRPLSDAEAVSAAELLIHVAHVCRSRARLRRNLLVTSVETET
jgi:hypothetical protein